VAQRGRGRGGPKEKPHKVFRHMRNCARIRDLYRATRARRHQLALAGVLWAMHHAEVSSLSDKSELRRVFDAEVRGQEARWYGRVDCIAHSRLAWQMGLLRSLGPRRALAGRSLFHVEHRDHRRVVRGGHAVDPRVGHIDANQ